MTPKEPTAVTTVALEEMMFYAYHGVLPQEQEIGNQYVVTVEVQYDWSRAMKTDCVDDTLDYALLYQLVQQEMQQPSKLLEHVAGRIAQSIHSRFPNTQEVYISIQKLAPPIPASLKGASVSLRLRF